MTSVFATSDFLLNNGVNLALVLGAFGLVVAVWLISRIRAASPGNERMKEVAAAVQEGAKAYLNRQVTAVGIIAALIFGLLYLWKKDMAVPGGFLIGAVCSLAAGYIGMRIAVLANVRTTQAASESEPKALRVAFNGGAVTGLLVVGLALLSVGAFFLMVKGDGSVKATQHAVDSLVGLALGASLISVFARLGGGIYTKAADVGADLVGKVESNLNEDDPRNPATIADNVGDNVGDCAGMAADVFETYAVALIGALLIGALQLSGVTGALVYPFAIGGISVIGAVLGVLFVNFRSNSAKADRALIEGVVISGLVSAVLYWPVTMGLLPDAMVIGGKTFTPMSIYGTAIIGLLMTFGAVLITNYYTSTKYHPVRCIAKASETGHGTNVIAGLAVGNTATALPVLVIVVAIYFSYQWGDLFGVATAVMSMLSMAGIIISLDAFGPITDNAGGIAVMSGLPDEVRHRTDSLDAVGNTMKAVTKGYAIASAGLAALVLFGSYYLDLDSKLRAAGKLSVDAVTEFSLKDPRVVIGMFLGGLLPFLFSAMGISAVGRAAGAVVVEVRRQIAKFPGILTGKDKPEYAACVDIVTKAALREMILPALLPVLAVLIVAGVPVLGKEALGGMLVGTIVTGLFVGISMTSAGGAWDNAKKYIEEGNHGGKGSDAHKAAVTGDTVGDPYKDTAGPAVNPMIKVVNIVAILVIELFFL
ncbi:MAG TPA: sodium-translocating pyrophosphatase [Verrucomicrobiales bacterium]|jgi:K(+)-stimulated pyrophosphate-energized sodium pump|nr:sodium-translocating pyrophosphatase [Verrucomicrobiales bacterium]